MPASELDQAHDLMLALLEADSHIKQFIKGLREKYKGRIVTCKDQEYAIEYIDYDIWHGYVYAQIERVNKRQPWVTVDKSTIRVNLADLRVSDQTLTEREDAVSA